MNLPIISQLKNNESTYITLSRALLDLDKSLMHATQYYFSKVVAINLPDWKNPDFYKTLSDIGISSDNPNLVIPKLIQHYTENIIRQDIQTPHIAELAFYKTLNYLGLNEQQIQNAIVFCNDIVTSNFIETENNNGWGTIVCQIPNMCREFLPILKPLDLPETYTDLNEYDISVSDANEQQALYDNGERQFVFSEINKVLDFDNLIYTDTESSSFEFNALLLFYRDIDGVDKLHGINFIYPYENKVTHWEPIRFNQKTNIGTSIGYQFVFNIKTCNNEVSKNSVYVHNEQALWWNGFEKTLTGLNSFLESRIRDLSKDKLSFIPDIK